MKKNKSLVQLNKKNKKSQNYGQIIKITLIAFTISLLFSTLSELTLPNINAILGIIIVLFFILIGVLFDMIGVAVTSSDIAPFHSMNSRQVKGANVAIKLIKNASLVSSFCCDVVGDVCGIISGSVGVVVATKISTYTSSNTFIISLIGTSLIAALTIGGKAFGKSIAINKSNFIVYRFARIFSILKN